MFISFFDGIRRGPVIQRPCGVGWHSSDTPRNCCELYTLGAHWFHIQLWAALDTGTAVGILLVFFM